MGGWQEGIVAEDFELANGHIISHLLADRVKQLRKGTGVPAVGKVVAAAAAESIENCDPNEERRVSKELCLQDVVFPIDDDMSSGGDDFLPQVKKSFPVHVCTHQLTAALTSLTTTATCLTPTRWTPPCATAT